MRLTLDAKVTTGDEATGDGEYLVGRKRNVKRLGDGGRVVDKVKNRLVTRFNRHDGRGCSEHRRVGDQVSRSEVRGNADILDRARDGCHSGN